ncbi:amastin, putative [Trypanosoma cruzi marinkellei]|uniref:Amastin, putative n=1 Tax=Trypanosoma cruzi marinkellei TaxID=85056 RepID=K2PC41_TRYCR|nr:amastin, putative [Trypanosoma cruzi marinkellei]
MSFLPDRNRGEEEICDGEHPASPPKEQRQLPPVAAVSSVPLQPRVSHEEPPTATCDASAAISRAGGAGDGGGSVKVRKLRIFDDITTTTSSSEMSEGHASTSKERSVLRHALPPPRESDIAERNMSSAIPPTPLSSSTQVAPEAVAAPVSHHQVEISVSNRAGDAPVTPAEVRPSPGPEEGAWRGSPPRSRGDAHDEDIVVGMRKKLSEKIVECWEFGTQADTYVLVMFVSSVFSFVLTVVAAPLSQLDVVWGACYTYWGYKENCDSLVYNNRTPFITCDPVRKRLQAGAAFSMITVALLFVAVVCCGFLLRQNLLKLRLFTLLVLTIALVFQMISWALVASIFGARYCEDRSLPRTTTYGVAFGMSLSSWFFIMIGALACIVPYFY